MADKNTGTCILCGKNKRLIRAHALPKAYMRFLGNEEGKTAWLSLINDERLTDCLPFDRDLFCEKCDNSFSGSEGELIKLSESLIEGGMSVKNADGKYILINQVESDEDVQVDEFDVLEIKKALLFLLYKLSLSPRCESIKLNQKHEDVLKQMLYSGRFDNNEIGICLSHYLKSNKVLNNGHKKAFFAQGAVTHGDMNFISILLPGALGVLYRIDKRLLCGCKNELQPNQENELCGCKREMDQNSNFFYLQVIVDGFDFDNYYYH